MRIAILGSVALPVPPPAQGGTEWIAYYQAIGLAKKGHKILLFAAKGTATHFVDIESIEVIETGEGDVVAGSKKQRGFDAQTTEGSRPLRLETTYLGDVAKKLIERKDDYDVVLNNMRGEGALIPPAALLGKKFVNVMHLNLFEELASLFKPFDTHVITISNTQRNDFPGLNYLATVYNGIDLSLYPFLASPDDYLLMIASIGRHKNQKDAIAVAKKLNMRLILAGKIRDQDYFEELQKDIDGTQIVYKGEIDLAEKVPLYQRAKAFLFPIEWEEPFGLVMIEAMSCGTPVIAYNKGAISEVVIDGKTGFIVNTVDEMAQAVEKIDTIERKACREHVEKHFTVENMIDMLDKALGAL